MVNIQECLEEYAENLKDNEKKLFLGHLSGKPDFSEKAGSALKQVGVFLAMLQLEQDSMSEEDKIEFNKICKKMILEIKNEPKEIAEMRMFYLENYKEIIDDVDEEETLSFIDNKVNQILDQIRHRIVS